MAVVKIILKGIGAFVSYVVSGVVGWLVGATYGGNNDVTFYFGGVPGYEAWGLLGAQLFGAIGLGFGAWLLLPKRWQLPNTVVWVSASLSTVVFLTWQLYSTPNSHTVLASLLPIILTAGLVYGHYWLGVNWRQRLYMACGVVLFSLTLFLFYTLGYNYACLRTSLVCFVEAPTVTITTDAATEAKAAIIGEPVKLISHLNLYGDVHTLERYCSDIELVWDFGDGTIETKSGCANYPPNMQPSTRGWVKHSYIAAGEYRVTLQLSYQERTLASSQQAISVY